MPDVLDIGGDVIRLAAALVDIPSESHDEARIADAVEVSLRAVAWLDVSRHGHTVVARTGLGRAERVVVAGHLDTVPAKDNLPHRVDGDRLVGLGACDMKGGVAVGLALAATVEAPSRDVTYVFYECEEVESRFNGLGRLAASAPELLAADLAILMEPSNGVVEAGCQGTLRAEVTVPGQRAHSARAWLGTNAIHGAGAVLDVLRGYEPRRPVVDGLEYHEGLNAVGIRGGVAGNVVPDVCMVTVNYRFAPDRSEDDAVAHVHEVFGSVDGVVIDVVDIAPGARPGLDRPATADFLAAVGEPARPKFGWTDVARFTALDIPALNFGPGDPSLAHTEGEYTSVAQVRSCLATMRDWLG